MEVLNEARQPVLSALAGLAGYLGRCRRIFVVQVRRSMSPMTVHCRRWIQEV
jgi:hypothetical protein